MKKILNYIVVSMVLFMMVSCTPGTGVQISTPVANNQSGTPTPPGQIEVPGFYIQLNAPGINPLVNTPDLKGHVAGLLTGVWHGILSPGTLIMSFFNPTVQMYEVHNDGSQYNLGFLLGEALIFLILGILLGRRA